MTWFDFEIISEKIHFTSRQKTCNECVNYRRKNILCTCIPGGFVFQLTRGYFLQLLKKCWFSIKYIVKRRKIGTDTSGTWVHGAYFFFHKPLWLSPKGKTSHKKIVRIFSITFVIPSLNSLGFCIVTFCEIFSQWFRNITDLVYNLVRRNTNMATLRPSQRI